MRALKILYCGVQYGHYNPQEGLNLEYHNLYDSLCTLPGAEVVHILFDRILEIGKKKFNEDRRVWIYTRPSRTHL